MAKAGRDWRHYGRHIWQRWRIPALVVVASYLVAYAVSALAFDQKGSSLAFGTEEGAGGVVTL
jgi:hypothetical protein